MYLGEELPFDGEDELVWPPWWASLVRDWAEGEEGGWHRVLQQHVVQGGPNFLAGFYHLVGCRWSGCYEDVINPAAMVLVLLVVAVKRMLPIGRGVQGVETNVTALSLVLLVHMATGEGGPVPRVQGGIPVTHC